MGCSVNPSLYTYKYILRFAKQTSQTVQRCYFSAKVRMVSNAEHILTSIYKEILPLHHNNFLIYLFKFSCGSCYIKRSNQRLDARIKQYVPTKICNFISEPINVKNAYGSSIAEHLIDNRNCTENFSVDLILILNKSHSSFQLKILETIYISM